MRTREQIEAQLRADNPISDGFTTGHPEYEARIARWVDAMLAQDALAHRASARASLRAQYMGLPSYIRGPLFPAFIAANQLLDLGLDADAAQIIEYADPPKKFNQAKLAEFETIRQTFAAAITALAP